MPKVRRQKLPQAVLFHLLTRMRERKISSEQLTLLGRWLDTEPEVPIGKWYKKFTGFAVCGEGEFIKSFLLPGQVLDGQEIH